MKIISIGFKNPFHESGYTNTIKINNLDDINVFIGKNNSGKTTILDRIYYVLSRNFNKDGPLLRFTIELNSDEFIERFKEFYEKYEKNTPSPYSDPYITKLGVKLSSLVKSFIEKVQNSDIKNKLTFKLNFNRDPQDKIILELSLKSKNQTNNENNSESPISKKEIDIFNQSIKQENELKILLLNLTLPTNKVKYIPSLRKLESSTYDFEREDVDYSIEALNTILNQSFRIMPKHKYNLNGS